MEEKEGDNWETPRVSRRSDGSQGNMAELREQMILNETRMTPSALVRPLPSEPTSANIDRYHMDAMTPTGPPIRQIQRSRSQFVWPSQAQTLNRLSASSDCVMNSNYCSSGITSGTRHCHNPALVLDCHDGIEKLQRDLDALKMSLPSSKTNSFQMLLREKCDLEEKLGATEYELNAVRNCLADFQQRSSMVEQSLSHKLALQTDSCQRFSEKQLSLVSELEQLRSYLSQLPTASEHEEVKKQLNEAVAQAALFKEKLNLMTEKLNETVRLNFELKNQKEVLVQEKEDLCVKLSVSDNMLNDISKQRQETETEGQVSKEDLLWKLEHSQKENESARKLLDYRKQKLRTAHEELVAQQQLYMKQLQAAELENEQIREQLSATERRYSEKLLNEEKMQKQLDEIRKDRTSADETLQLAKAQIRSQCLISTDLATLFAKIVGAVQQLQDLVTLSNQMSHDASPDLSLLLNCTSPLISTDAPLNLENISIWMGKVDVMCKQLRAIKTHLQDQYAGHLAANVSCAQM